ncbi:MAG: efflux RND transporter periplasmic adaptor subunit [Desulfobacterales bacterium]|nr:efflux RND transporter periplasmic adaptor subunit [Desulfobacterales bacterium]
MNEPKQKRSLVATFLKIVLPLCLIAGGVYGNQFYKSKKMDIKRKPKPKPVMAVETVKMVPESYTSQIRVMGTVLPDREVVLKAQVSGRVVNVSPKFVQGGLIPQGEILVQVEQADYKLAVDKAQSALDKALADLEIEKGQQHIAREELKLITQLSPEGVKETSLALRKPQLEQAKAEVASARSDLENARLDLKRTQIRVPFHALVLEKHVDLGSMAAAQESLATLVDVTQYRVEVQVPLDRLSRIKIHETKGSPARIRSLYADHEWPGQVSRATGKVTGQSRMAGVIIQVPDPLGLASENNGSPLLLDDHVEALIQGEVFENVYALPRVLVRENSTLWVYDNGRLQIRQIKPVWKEDDRVFLQSGIQPGDLIITSDIPVPVPGMALVLDPGERS